MHGVLQPRLDMELRLSGSEEVFAPGNPKRCAEQERMSCHLDHHLFFLFYFSNFIAASCLFIRSQGHSSISAKLAALLGFSCS
jgi:hypothetical protein